MVTLLNNGQLPKPNSNDSFKLTLELANALIGPSLRENCPYSEFFWSVFYYIWTEYGQIRSESLRIQSECWKIRSRKTLNTDTFCAVAQFQYRIEPCYGLQLVTQASTKGISRTKVGRIPATPETRKRCRTWEMF